MGFGAANNMKMSQIAFPMVALTYIARIKQRAQGHISAALLKAIWSRLSFVGAAVHRIKRD